MNSSNHSSKSISTNCKCVEDHTKNRIEGVECLTVGTRKLAAMLDVSPRSVDRADAAGQLPSPVFIGGSKKFLLEGSRGIRAWLLAGCPRREDFEGDTTIQTGGGDVR